MACSRLTDAGNSPVTPSMLTRPLDRKSRGSENLDEKSFVSFRFALRRRVLGRLRPLCRMLILRVRGWGAPCAGGWLLRRAVTRTEIKKCSLLPLSAVKGCANPGRATSDVTKPHFQSRPRRQHRHSAHTATRRTLPLRPRRQHRLDRLHRRPRPIPSAASR